MSLRTTRSALIWIGLALLLAAPPLLAQGWSGTLGGAWVAQDVSGSEDSYRTQFNLDDGFLLERLDLSWTAGEDDPRAFDFRAWGFGNAEPAQGADLAWRAAKKWRFNLEYRRNESYFSLVESDLSRRHDDWSQSRWRGAATWDGWKAARLTLSLGYVERSGLIAQPFRALNASYLLGIDLDETQQKAALRLETRTLPVKLVFEQSLAVLDRENRWFPASAFDVNDDPDLFLDAPRTRDEERKIPISRLSLAWSGDRVEVTGAVLYSPADFDASGESTTLFGLDGDTRGRIALVDDIVASGSFDTFFGHLGVGIKLAPKWTLRLTGEHRDRSQDATLLGERILRLSNALGEQIDIPLGFDESTLFDVTDRDLRVEIEHRRGDWSVWAGYFDDRREVSRSNQGEAFTERSADVDRTSDGALVGVAWSRSRKLKASFEYEHGSFEEFVFRTDPETVDRYTLKLRSHLAHGFDLQVRRRYESADNPASQSNLDRTSESTGFGLVWAAEDGKCDVGVDFDLVDLTTETILTLPGEVAGLSRYDLSLQSLGVHGRAAFGKVVLTGSATRFEDNGETWPLSTWTARARLAYTVTEATEVALFGRYDSYDEDLAEGDDFDVTRYGVAFAWRFQ